MSASILVHEPQRNTVLCGIGFGLIFIKVVYQAFSKGIINKFDIVNKEHSIQGNNVKQLMESPINFQYLVKERTTVMLCEARILSITYWLLTYIIIISCIKPILQSVSVND